MFARAIRLVLLAGSLCFTSLGACGGPQPAESDPEPPTKKRKAREHPPDKDAVSEKGKSWGGWRWKGDRNDCFYVYKNKCYDSKSRACEAANCGKSSCAYKSGAPTKVSCKK